MPIIHAFSFSLLPTQSTLEEEISATLRLASWKTRSRLMRPSKCVAALLGDTSFAGGREPQSGYQASGAVRHGDHAAFCAAPSHQGAHQFQHSKREQKG
jgi:hypothetical protein